MKKLSDSYVEGVIKKTTSGQLTTKAAAARLGCTRQYVNKLKSKYKAEGKAAFVHGNTGKERRWKTGSAVESAVVILYSGKYSGFNFRHFCEKLNEDEAIALGYKAVRRILCEAGFRSPKAHKSRRRPNEHPSRPRKDNFGEMLQTDASLHPWFGEGLPKATLHGAIDDATGTVMGLFFDKEETLFGYYEMAHQIFVKYGIPSCFYSDNRTVFEYRKLSEKDKTVDRDVHVNFKRMCMQMGIELITTSVPEAKGRIERLWGTLQSRLMSELRLRGIATIDAANAFLPAFTADYNKRFASKPDMESSLFAPAPPERELDFYLSTEYSRTPDCGSTFGLFGKRMMLFDENMLPVRATPHLPLTLYVTRSRKVVGVWKGKVYEAMEAPKAESSVPEKKPGRPRYIPPKDSPWRKFVINPKKSGNK